jgi:alkylation response protein AidB-like acyl-CoA dehydrogenase
MSGPDIVRRARGLQADIRARAEEIERERRVPEDLVDALGRAGCYRLFSPVSQTRQPVAYRDVLHVVETLAEADGSVGWTVSQNALGQVILGYLPTRTLEDIYAAGPDVRIAGAFAPRGRATPNAGGWQVSGQWPFATGCQSAAWVYVQCFVFEKRRVPLTVDQMPETRLAVFRADEVEVLDTWDAVGLRGTGSHDIRVNSRSCPDERTCSLAEADARGDGIQSVPLLQHAGLLVAAVTVGIATGAVQDVVNVAKQGKRPTFSARRLSEDPVFHDRLGQAYMRTRAARALLYSQAVVVESAMNGVVLPDIDRVGLRATCHHVTALAVDAVDTVYTLARSAAIPHSSPLQRRLRDIHTATQHAWNSSDASQALGARLLSESD